MTGETLGLALFAVEDGRAKLRMVALGQRNDMHAEALSGLSEGDQVIVHPSDAIAEGVAVRLRTF